MNIFVSIQIGILILCIGLACNFIGFLRLLIPPLKKTGLEVS